MNPLAKPRYQLETESLPSTAAVGVAAGRVSQVSAEEEREPWDSGFKRRHGRGREGTSTRKFSFSIDGGGSGENRRRCRDSHRDLQGAPTRLNPSDPDSPRLRLSAAPKAAAPAVLGRARRPGPRARRSDVTHALTSPAAAASEAGLGAGGA